MINSILLAKHSGLIFLFQGFMSENAAEFWRIWLECKVIVFGQSSLHYIIHAQFMGILGGCFIILAKRLDRVY